LIQQALDSGRQIIAGVIDHPPILLSGFEESGVLEIDQVTGGFGLGNVKGAHDLAHTEGTLPEKIQNHKPCLVRKGLEECG
jgi:hypothetical protein